MNMFSETLKEAQINSINDCTRIDPVSDNLWTWAKRIETLGKILFWILIIDGLILSILSGYAGIGIEKYLMPNDNEFNFNIFLMSFLEYGLYAYLEFCSYHILALLIGSLASIVQNTRTTAKLAEYTARKEFPEADGRISVGGNATKPISNTKIGKCEMCGKDITKITLAKFSDKTGTYRRKMCDHCIKEYNATITE